MPRSDGRWGERAFVVSWLVGLALLAWSGTSVDAYKLHVLDVPLPHPYPWNEVIVMAAVLTGEHLVLYAVVRPLSYDRSWGRALAALGMTLLLATIFGVLLMHAPPYMMMHWLLLAAGALAFLVLACVSLVGRLRAR